MIDALYWCSCSGVRVPRCQTTWFGVSAGPRAPSDSATRLPISNPRDGRHNFIKRATAHFNNGYCRSHPSSLVFKAREPCPKHVQLAFLTLPRCWGPSVRPRPRMLDATRANTLRSLNRYYSGPHISIPINSLYCFVQRCPLRRHSKSA